MCITDHWKLAPLKYNPYQDLKILYGVEISCKFGDILAYGLKSIPPKKKNIDAEKVIEFIHKQGGIAVCAHPYTNRHEGFGDYVYDYQFDGIEINGSLDKKYHRLAEKAANSMDIPTLGGSDAHSVRQLNTFGTKFEKPIKSINDIVNAVKNKECKALKIYNTTNKREH